MGEGGSFNVQLSTSNVQHSEGEGVKALAGEGVDVA